MGTTEQSLMQTVAKHEERLAAHDRRITKNEDLTVQIHKLSSCVENLTNEVKTQNERMGKIVESFGERMKTHGERIGELEKKGTKRLEAALATAATVLITAALVYFLSQLGLNGGIT